MQRGTLDKGERVKLSAQAFINGVYPQTREAMAKRGTLVRKARAPEMYVVRWDDRKTLERLHQDFIMKATTGAPRGVY